MVSPISDAGSSTVSGLQPSDPSPFSWRDRLRYRVDTALATGAVWWVIVWLASIMIGFLLLTAAIIGATGLQDGDGREFGYLEGFWQALLRALDPGTMAADAAWPLRVTSLTVSVIGVLLVSTLIGITATGISAHLAEIRRGRVPMTEVGHTLILGWSSKVQTLVVELAEGHRHDPGASVVIMAPHEKAEMDDQVRGWLRESPPLRVLTRTGVPHVSHDMRIVNPQYARSIIVLRNGAIDGDARVVRTVLALLHDLRVPDHIPIIAEMGSGDAATALRGVVDTRVIVMEPGNLIARVIAQACRHPGVDQVLAELLAFEGSELYESVVPEVEGMTFGDALMSFEASVPIGIIGTSGDVLVRPAADRVIGSGDRLVSVAEDATQIRFVGPRQTAAAVPAVVEATRSDEPERGLMFGFNEFAPLVISELDDYVPAGSTLRIVADPDLVTGLAEQVPAALEHLEVETDLLRLRPGGIAAMLHQVKPDYVIVLCYRGELTPADADARTLITFLEAGRAIVDAGLDTNVVAEILDPSDVNLVPADWSNEFVVTEHLCSLFITQVSENKRLAPVFDDLLDADGSEIYCKPIEWYAQVGRQESFAALTRSAIQRHEVAIGYRRERAGSSLGCEIVINPTKSTAFRLRTGDALIVLAEDEH